MSAAKPGQVAASAELTRLLHEWRNGDGRVFSVLIEQAYPALKRIALQRVDQQNGAATLSPTELVHETALGMMQSPADFANRAHFFATMSLAMRSILVDRARARAADKRGGDCVQISLSGVEAGDDASMAVDLLALEQALTELEALDPRCGQVMHLTYFGGLQQEEIAVVLGVSVPTVKRDLRFARSWLLQAIGDGSDGDRR
ncbi:ECF-type sigma factor [Dokdonella sp.]|uniref:ECF-type sigma factor n=1 Tax=Dokdonella sp. TaxID=2291710 RepID=UPI001B0ABAE0|nr:ECF-type sigma factor [Dokdonella sp.]MBO9663924.1 sigma-70 family RNA polymerase sigma factor [Dokdonella sp.]